MQKVVLRFAIYAIAPIGSETLMHDYSSNQEYFDIPTYFQELKRLWDKHGELIVATIGDRDLYLQTSMQILCDAIAQEKRDTEAAKYFWYYG